MRLAHRLRPGAGGQFRRRDGRRAGGVLEEPHAVLFSVIPAVVGDRRRRGRDRHHEHHADGRDRAHARDRHSQGGGRDAARHRTAVPRRGDHAGDVSAACSACSSAGASPTAVAAASPLPARDHVVVGRRSRVGLGAGVGVLFGVYPARRARRGSTRSPPCAPSDETSRRSDQFRRERGARVRRAARRTSCARRSPCSAS